jgi:transmembrane sensor
MTPIRPPQPDFPDSAALLRYVSGQSPLAEAEAVRAWIGADPARQASIDELRAAWSTPAAVPMWDGAGVWAKLSTELAQPTQPEHAGRPPRQSAPTFARRIAPASAAWTRVAARAAAIVAVVGAGALMVARPWSAEPVEMRELVTTHGQRTTVTLADGSRVTLDAATRLRVPTDLGTRSSRLAFWRAPRPRRLELIGRAYFDVVHDATRPFIVDTRTASTEDIGTAFVIAAYAEDTVTQVAVVEGSVALRDNAWPAATEVRPGAPRTTAPRTDAPLMVLTRGDVATLDARGTATRTRGVELASFTSWTNGVLKFDRAPLREVAAALNRWYDIDVRVADSALAHRRLTAEIRTETADETLARIGLVLGVSVERDGRRVVLSPRASGRQVGR